MKVLYKILYLQKKIFIVLSFFTKNIKIAPEGIYIILSSAIVLGITSALLFFFSFFWLAIFSLVLLVLIFYFFRDPNRPGLEDKNIFLSPVDGKVISITHYNDPDIGDAKKIAIFLSVFDVHRQWVPVNGKVVDTYYNPGKFFGAYRNKSSMKNEQTSIIFKDQDKNSFKIKQIAGFIARRIVNHMSPNLQVYQGQKLGFIKFGSRVEIIVPHNFQIQVKKGMKVKGCKTKVGTFINL